MKNNYLVFRLKPESDLYAGIKQQCEKQQLKAASVVSAVGCVKHLVIRTADGVSLYQESCEFEVTSLSGTISEDGLHLHIQVCDKDLRSFGGHLQPGTIVNTTMEIVLVNLENEYRLRRIADVTTGYDELQVQEK